MPPGLESVLRRQRRWAALNRRDYLRSRDRNLQGHLNNLPEYRRAYRNYLVLCAQKARDGIASDTVCLKESEQRYLAKGFNPIAVKLLIEADRLVMIRSHATQFRLNVRQEVVSRYQGLLLLPLVNSWQDCLQLKAERDRILASIPIERKGLLPNCTRLYAWHRRLLRAFDLL